VKYHALVIDDSDEILEDVKDRLESLGHTCDCVGSQEKARELIASNGYSYVLLDLEIPVKYGRPSRKLNGQNLLNDIKTTRGHEDIPIIVMTSYGHNSPDLATDVMRGNGAIDYVKKPFPDTGRTLERAIQDALAASGRSRPGAAPRSEPHQENPLRPFEEGEMVFFDDRVELCGLKVSGKVGSTLIRRILDELRDKNTNGRYVAYSAPELATRIKCKGRDNGIAGAVRDFRTKATDLLCGLRVEADRRDIIQSGGRGYRLTEKITVVNGNDPINEIDDPVYDPVNDPGNDQLDHRHKWIMSQLRDHHPLQISAIEAKFRCSDSTASRLLTHLKKMKLIEFIGAPKTGHYKLK
jgi:CheY-like chemotaxis protein